jgi:DNA polymerase III sliding clamp (beta) subunit (PCNA family)
VTKELKVDVEALTDEVAWLGKMPTVEPESAVVQITLLLSALLLRRVSGEQYRESVMVADGGDQGTVLVSTTKLLDVLKSMTGRVALAIDNGSLSIESDERKSTIKSADEVVDFPQWPQFNGKGKEVLTSREIAQVLTSVSTDETLPALTTVAFDNGTMVSTDRHRLSRVIYDQSGFTGQVSSTALRAFAKADSAVFVESGTSGEKDWVQLRLDRRSVTIPMSDVSFPNWRKLIPEDQPIQVAISRGDLIKAVTGDTVTLTVDGDAIMVVSESEGTRTEQKVKLFQTVKNELDGPIAVTISSKYVRDSLRALNSGLVMFCVTAADKPVVFQDISEKDVHLLMPIKKAG